MISAYDVPMTLVRRTDSRSWLSKSDEHLRRDVIKLLQGLREEPESTRDWARLDELVEAFVISHSRAGKEVSPHTLRAACIGARMLLGWAMSGDGGVDVVRMGRRDAQRYMLFLRDRAGGVRPATLQARLSGARGFMRLLKWAEVRLDDPFEDVRVDADPTEAIVRRPPYDEASLNVVRSLADLPGLEARRLWLANVLCLHAGLRIAEALDVRRADVEHGELLVRGKGGKERRVPLSPQLQGLLSEVPPWPDGRYLHWTYRELYHRMFEVFRKHGLKFRGFHALRKVCGTRLFDQTRDFSQVAWFLGHASVDTTRKYVQVKGEQLSSQVLNWPE